MYLTLKIDNNDNIFFERTAEKIENFETILAIIEEEKERLFLKRQKKIQLEKELGLKKIYESDDSNISRKSPKVKISDLSEEGRLLYQIGKQKPNINLYQWKQLIVKDIKEAYNFLSKDKDTVDKIKTAIQLQLNFTL